MSSTPPKRSSHTNRVPTSPALSSVMSPTASTNFVDQLVEENERMLYELEELREQNQHYGELEDKVRQFAEENAELKTKLATATEVVKTMKESQAHLSAKDDALVEIKQIIRDASPGKQATNTPPPPEQPSVQEELDRSKKENEELHVKLQNVFNELSRVGMLHEQTKLDNSHLLEKNKELSDKYAKAMASNDELVRKYGVSAEEGKRIQEQLAQAHKANNQQGVLNAKFEEMLNKTEYDRKDLQKLFSDFFDEQEKSQQVHNDRMTAAELKWKETVDTYKHESTVHKRRIAELETELRNFRMTIRRDPNAADGTNRALVTPRGTVSGLGLAPNSGSGANGSPSGSSGTNGLSASTGAISGVHGSGSPPAGNIMDHLRGGAVSTPRNPPTAGYVKRCPVCTYANDGNTQKCQVCSTVLPPVA